MIWGRLPGWASILASFTTPFFGSRHSGISYRHKWRSKDHRSLSVPVKHPVSILGLSKFSNWGYTAPFVGAAGEKATYHAVARMKLYPPSKGSNKH